MNLGSGRLRQLRHLGRYRQIMKVLVKHGFSQVLARLRLYGLRERIIFLGQKNSAATPPDLESALRTVLEELGPAFIKLGQLLSTRADLLPQPYIEELSRLQDRVPPFSPVKAQEILAAELEAERAGRIVKFQSEPLAAASIGQVHRAVLHSGEEVVIKIKRPGVDRLVRQDLEILEEIAAFVDRNTAWGELYQFSRIAGELKQIILRELDYKHEARNAERLRRNFSGDPAVYLPRVYWEYTTRNVLTLEYRAGITLNRYLEKPPAEPSPRKVAAILADAFFKQFLVDGFFHGDPHPGNMALLPDGRLFFMDFGAAGAINESRRGKFVMIARAFQSGDTAAMIDELSDFAFVPPGIDRFGLIEDLERLQERYLDLPLKDIEIGAAIEDLLQLSAKYRLSFPHEFLLLARALAILEGTVVRLDPQFNLIEAAAKYGPALQKGQLKLTLRRLQATLRGYRRLLEQLPEHTGELVRASAAGELKIRVELPQVESIMSTVKSLGNRLGLSIILASLIIALSQHLKFTTMKWLEKIPLGEIVLIVAVVTGLGLIWATISAAKR